MIEYTGELKSRLPNEGTSIFAIMSEMAAKNNALNLSQGFPNFPISKELIEKVHYYMQKGHNQYAPMHGLKNLREQIVNKYSNLYNVNYCPETEINITAGATQAIYTTITSLVHPGDEVIVFDPAYDSYIPAIRLSGGSVRFCQLKAPDFSIDFDQLKSNINSKTRMIIINTPHNPTGKLITHEEMLELEKIINGRDILLLSDEVYEHLTFDDKKHESACKYPGLINNTIIIGSFGKTFHATGWKMGYALAPKNIIKEFRKVHQFVVFTCNTPVQYALADFLEDANNYLYLNDFYQKKRDLFLQSIENSRFKVIPSEGTYFQLLDYSDISNEEEMEFAKKLIVENKIAAIPIAPFYSSKLDQKLLRFCFAKTDETLIEAGKILSEI
ncbi:MAG: methionine aminotransferase [Bacteroidales bacterium]